MEMANSIAEMSMAMSQVQFQQSLGTTLLKKSMDMSQTTAEAALRMLDASAPAQVFPGDIGSLLDVNA